MEMIGCELVACHAPPHRRSSTRPPSRRAKPLRLHVLHLPNERRFMLDALFNPSPFLFHFIALAYAWNSPAAGPMSALLRGIV